MNHAKSILIALLLGLLPSLRADQFTASYIFPALSPENEMCLSASFSGTLSDGLITNIHGMAVNVAGSWWEYNDSFAPDDIHEGGSVMSLDGSYMNFRFCTNNEVEEDTDPWDRNALWMGFTEHQSTSLYFFVAGGNYEWDASRWSVQQVFEEEQFFARMAPESESVPDSSGYGMLVITLLSAFIVRRNSANQR
jgi:hypothetical protein